MTIQPKYPNAVFDMSGGIDGNAIAITVAARNALRRARVSAVEVEAFTTEALSGNYDHVLITVMNWLTVVTAD